MSKRNVPVLRRRPELNEKNKNKIVPSNLKQPRFELIHDDRYQHPIIRPERDISRAIVISTVRLKRQLGYPVELIPRPDGVYEVRRLD